ncbi:MAG: hypothetical protein QOG18_1754 [Microbacteriaceae bacterium]|nr:hypothetical protein [Microbacteriaceae bacterium]
MRGPRIPAPSVRSESVRGGLFIENSWRELLSLAAGESPRSGAVVRMTRRPQSVSTRTRARPRTDMVTLTAPSSASSAATTSADLIETSE